MLMPRHPPSCGKGGPGRTCSSPRHLGTRWVAFGRFGIKERTEHDVLVCAPHDDPGLPKYRKRPDGSEVRKFSGEWLFKDDNARRAYTPLREEPDLFVKFASLASRDLALGTAVMTLCSSGSRSTVFWDW